MKEITHFKMIRPISDSHKGSVGKDFECFGGLVSGVDGVSFLDKTYFLPVWTEIE